MILTIGPSQSNASLPVLHQQLNAILLPAYVVQQQDNIAQQNSI